ncbi:MAG TPA: tetratricopeptide repeat protein [Gallionella sp.]
MHRFYMFALSAWLVLLAGCAGVATRDTASDGISPDGIVEPVPAPLMSENKAVVALLDRAQSDTGAGRHEAAGASLERALRIEPRNPWLWHQLAQLRLSQGQYAQAVAVARKSISFAGQDRRLLALNWRLIGDARVAQGDTPGAEKAYSTAEEYVQ